MVIKSDSPAHSPDTLPALPSQERARRRSHLTTAALVEAALLLDLVVLLIVIRTYIPIPGFQGVMRLLCPAPFILLALRRDVRTCLTATVASYFLLTTLIGPIFATQILVFGCLAAVFAFCAQRRLHPAFAIVTGAVLYGVFYLYLQFAFGLYLLHQSVKSVVSAVQEQVHSITDFLLRLHIGATPLRATPVHLMTSAADWLVTNWMFTVILGMALYSLANIWAYLIVSREIIRFLPAEVRTDTRGKVFGLYT